MKISNCVRVSRWGKDFSSLSRRPFLTQHESFLHARKQLIKEPRSAKNTHYFFIMTDRYIRFHLDFSSSVIHTIRKVTFLSKNSILRKPQHSFTKFFFTLFLVKSKLYTAKKSKTLSRVFHQKKKHDNFLGKSKLNFLTKYEDFEQ